ncbi:MAG: AraC family transcriptional regulator [Polyangiaceae bacterium]
MDALSRILETVRLRGSVLSIAELSAPFGVRTRGVHDGALFHAVVRGAAIVRAENPGGTEHYELGAGDVIVLAAGQAHEILDAPETPAVDIKRLPTLPGPVPTVLSRPGASEADGTRIVCGVFRIDHAASTALLSLLPPVLLHQAASAAPKNAEWVRATISLLDRELADGAEGGGAVATRLCDALFIQLLRSTPVPQRGFLAALADKQIGQALALIHEDPKSRWDAAVLAERVGMSRSRFFARFTEVVGEPPAQYLSRWRMTVAADELRSTDMTVTALAELAGYVSEDAFVRVFKRHFGLTPSAFRKLSREPAS